MTIGKSIANPTLKDTLDLFKREIFLSLNCHAIGTIQSFDPATQLVTASINYKKVQYTESGSFAVDYPVLVDVPAIILQGGLSALTFPIQAGDACLIFFNDRDIDTWVHSGQIGPVASPRLHSFADGIALVGLRSQANPIADYDTTRAVLRQGDTMVGVGPTLVKIANGVTTLNTLLQNLLTTLEGLTTVNSDMTTGALSPASIAALTAIATQIGGLLE